MPKVKYLKACGMEGCSTNHYAKGLCKHHYMAANRSKFNSSKSDSPKENQLDVEDLWQFVKKELNLG